MAKTIYLDPGHGGLHPGAVNNKRYEKNDNLKLAKAVEMKLKAQGHTVLLTRYNDSENPTLEARIAAANIAGADIFVSLHRNSAAKKDSKGNPIIVNGAYALDPFPKGIEIWVRYNNHTSAAGEVLEELAKVPNQGNRGVKIGAFLVLYGAKMPAMLVELGFISNPKDNELFDKHFDDNATAIAKGVLAALGEPWKEPGQPDNKPIYRMQVGAFSVRANAEAFLEIVRKQGLAAFIVEVEKNGSLLYRVQVGAFSIRANAEAFLADVKKKGLEAFMIEAAQPEEGH